ncbi:MAG: HAD family phosphatase [Bacteroidales bacterium]|jgi:beta-phosphoglucomutase|nr:HAD family phosphatase [Bacteroidales bacterium]
MIETIFFDLDGVIIDSEPVHAKAKKFTLDLFAINYPVSIFDDFIGQPDEAFFKHVSEELDAQKRPAELFLKEKQRLFVEILPEMKLIDGFFPFFQEVKKIGIKTALVSSTSTYTFGLIDENFNIAHLFDLLITEKDTINHKPHPDPYIKALQTLPASTESTIVIEDSPNGIISAKLAGCKVFALTTSFKTEKLAEADVIFDSYAEISKRLGLNN